MDINTLETITLSSRQKDYTGKKQGKLTYLKPHRKSGNRTFWWVQCECGEIEEKRTDDNREQCKKCGEKAKRKKLSDKNMIDLSGQVFGRLTALYPLEERRNTHIVWHCKCSCGKECDIVASSLVSGNTKSCGCLKKENTIFAKQSPNLVGKKFGYLTVLEKTDQRQYEKVVWKCQCECGNIIYLNTSRLTSRNDTSCGCKKTSLGAINIANLLKENNILYIKEYLIPLNNYRFDYAILDYNNNIVRFIEFDGEQHYHASGGWNTEEHLKVQKQRDKIKNEYALSHNIPLVRIPYWERDNITLEMIMGDKYLVR